MDKYEQWLRTRIKFCDLERDRLIKLYGTQMAMPLCEHVQAERRIYQECLKKYEEISRD